jgi:hypothetical protein
MVIGVIRHSVRDYATWRKVYDDVGPMQKAGGVTEESVYQAKDNPNDVLVLHKFNTMEEAERFFRGQDLKDAMQRAGVEGTPRIEMFEEARRLAAR